MANVLEQVWLTVDEASQVTTVCKRELYEALRSKTLSGSQNGKNGKWLIHADDLDTWMRTGRAA